MGSRHEVQKESLQLNEDEGEPVEGRHHVQIQVQNLTRLIHISMPYPGRQIYAYRVGLLQILNSLGSE